MPCSKCPDSGKSVQSLAILLLAALAHHSRRRGLDSLQPPYKPNHQPQGWVACGLFIEIFSSGNAGMGIVSNLIDCLAGALSVRS